MNSSLLSLFLPQGLLSHFEVIDLKEIGDLRTKKNCFYIYLAEKNALPQGYDSSAYESKGFYKPATIQDFPIRGKAVYLVIKRRRWRDKEIIKKIKSLRQPKKNS